jgi:hypothetical protein
MVVVISLAIAQDMPAAHEIRHGGSSWQKVFTSSRIGPLAQAAGRQPGDRYLNCVFHVLIRRDTDRAHPRKLQSAAMEPCNMP